MDSYGTGKALLEPESESEAEAEENPFEVDMAHKASPLQRYLPRSPARAAAYLCAYQLAVYIIGLGLMAALRPLSSASSSASSSSSSSSGVGAVTTPDAIDGGGWQLVRCVSAAEGTWHPATDNLDGTGAAYGAYSDDYGAGDATFSVQWDSSATSAYLFALTDLSLWLVAGTSTVLSHGAPLLAAVTASSASGSPYTAEWYSREGKAEDPWVSVFDHGAADPGMVYGEAGKAGHMEHLGVGGVGACVWVR